MALRLSAGETPIAASVAEVVMGWAQISVARVSSSSALTLGKPTHKVPGARATLSP